MRIACCILKATDIHSEYLLLLHGKNGYGNAPQYYVCMYITFFFYYLFVQIAKKII